MRIIKNTILLIALAIPTAQAASFDESWAKQIEALKKALTEKKAKEAK